MKAMQPVKVLLVEDEVLIALCLESELSEAGFHVCRRVGTGEEAILAAGKFRPDVILMDIRLAGRIDGIEAAEQIQASSPVPIIFMTGFLEAALKERAMKLQPLGFFTKPLSMRDIQRALASLP